MRVEPRAIIERLVLALHLKTQAQLAVSLEIRPQSIVSAINRGDIPDAWLYRVAYLTGRSVEWLRTGQGDAWHGSLMAEATAPAYGGDKRRPALWQRVVEAWEELNAEEQAAALRCVELLRHAGRDVREHLVAHLTLMEKIVREPRPKRLRSKRRGTH